MERCDFCSAMKIIREYISDERGLDQSEILYRLFESFFRSKEGEKLTLDNGQVCRWLNGQAKLSPQITAYYLKLFRKKDLVKDIKHNIIPIVFDIGMATQKAYELEQLHALLETDEKVFLCGIAGIGKSELAKAYAAQYRKKYTNILYLTYSGDLMQNITNMDFIDDMPTDSPRERFHRHNQFLRSLKEDTLFIIDNFNSTETQDSFLSVVLKYRCRILFTTRSKIAEHSNYLLEEISDKDALYGLFSHFYSDTQRYRCIVERIIDAVYAHTFAVELAARLLEHGILPPHVVLQKLQTQKTSMDADDQTDASKDGRRQKATYYEHIHILFLLYKLSECELNVLRGLSLAPLTGVPARQFAEWMGQSNMNSINDMIEMGFIQEKPLHMIGLHPMMQEITITDAKPSVSNCRLMLKNIQQICVLHGQDVENYKILFQIIENAAVILERDDEAFFLRFLEDAVPCMEKYRFEFGIVCLLKELNNMLSNPACGKIADRALLLDYTALYEDVFRGNKEKAAKLEKMHWNFFLKLRQRMLTLRQIFMRILADCISVYEKRIKCIGKVCSLCPTV